MVRCWPPSNCAVKQMARSRVRSCGFVFMADFHPSIMSPPQARVVLLGHGADELCAGYGRHRTRFKAEARFVGGC